MKYIIRTPEDVLMSRFRVISSYGKVKFIGPMLIRDCAIDKGSFFIGRCTIDNGRWAYMANGHSMAKGNGIVEVDIHPIDDLYRSLKRVLRGTVRLVEENDGQI